MKYQIKNQFGKVLNELPDRQNAELWLLHYEDMYNLTNLKIVESEVE